MTGVALVCFPLLRCCCNVICLQTAIFLVAYFICLVSIQPMSAAHRAGDLHVHCGESEKPPNGIFHSDPIGDISMAGHVQRFLSVRSLKDRWPWRSRERLGKIEQAGKYKRNSPQQPSNRTITTGEASY